MQAFLGYFQQYYACKNLGEITWAHAVNSQARLDETLNNPRVAFIEVDISQDSSGDLIAAHPPARSSDLSLSALLKAMAHSRQGLKLDFKGQEVVAPGLQMLHASDLQQPVMLNADILTGNMARPTSFDAEAFLSQRRMLYPRGLLSLGWTTHNDPTAVAYTQANIEEMLSLCQRHQIEQVTFPLRALHVPTSWQVVSGLLTKDGYTHTMWGKITPPIAEWLRQHTDPTVTCYDCLDEQRQAIYLP